LKLNKQILGQIVKQIRGKYEDQIESKKKTADEMWPEIRADICAFPFFSKDDE